MNDELDREWSKLERICKLYADKTPWHEERTLRLVRESETEWRVYGVHTATHETVRGVDQLDAARNAIQAMLGRIREHVMGIETELGEFRNLQSEALRIAEA